MIYALAGGTLTPDWLDGRCDAGGGLDQSAGDDLVEDAGAELFGRVCRLGPRGQSSVPSKLWSGASRRIWRCTRSAPTAPTQNSPTPGTRSKGSPANMRSSPTTAHPLKIHRPRRRTRRRCRSRRHSSCRSSSWKAFTLGNLARPESIRPARLFPMKSDGRSSRKRSAWSTACIWFSGRYPTWSPRRCSGSRAFICAQRANDSPRPQSTGGRRRLVCQPLSDVVVGMTSHVLRCSRRVAWATTPNRGPDCSWPRVLPGFSR
jgi:hypothetical protein